MSPCRPPSSTNRFRSLLRMAEPDAGAFVASEKLNVEVFACSDLVWQEAHAELDWTVGWGHVLARDGLHRAVAPDIAVSRSSNAATRIAPARCRRRICRVVNLSSPSMPAVTIIETSKTASLSRSAQTAYWSANIRLIRILLLVWGGSVLLPTLFAAELSRIRC
jgi:hypothetical protein